MEEFKEVQRATWEAGDFADLSQHIADVGERVVAEASVAAGQTVLDVACGTGNAAMPAARAGADVTGLDLAPSLLSAGQAKADAEGLSITWVEGDAEDLPFEDDSFDRVFSTFGHMFAPRHEKTAAEMARVCAPGGLIVTATWDPDGVVGEFFRTSSAYAPPPPDFASPPMEWGTEDHVREMFSSADDVAFDRAVTVIEWDSIEGFADYFIARFGPLVMAKQNLGDRFEELRGKILDIYERYNEATDGGLRLPQQYLISKVTVP